MKYLRLIGYALLVGSVVYFGIALWRHAGTMPTIAWNTATASGVVAVILLHMAQLLSTGFAWHLWLRAIGEPSQPWLAIVLTAFSQFAKYVPGSVAHHIARVAVAQRYHISVAGVVVSIGLEMGGALMVAGLIALAIGSGVGLPQLAETIRPGTASLLAVILLALGLPCVGIWLLGRHRPKWVGRWLRLDHLRYPPPGTIIGCFLFYALNMALCGLILSLLGIQIFGASELHLLFNIGLFSLAWIAGVVVLAAPGGLGIREAILLAGLTPLYGAGAALGITITYRVLGTIGDGLGFLFGYLAERAERRAR